MKKFNAIFMVAGLLATLVSCDENLSVSNMASPSIDEISISIDESSVQPSMSIQESTSVEALTSVINPASNISELDDRDDYAKSWIYNNNSNYYDYNKLAVGVGAALKTKLYNEVSEHTTVSYKEGLTSAYKTTDTWEDGTIWDMYGDFKFSLSGQACGNYKKEGDCWNKEHSMPKSWFNDASPMYSDIYHLFPTDGYVNNRRSNYPYGEVGNATYSYVTQNSAQTGLTLTNKLGPSSYPGYSDVVFEPDDMYKGDFARAYFYMVTAYENKVKSWKTGSTNLGGTTYPGLNGWSTELLLKWSLEDPISEKEIKRTEEAFKIQHNRNPYIDNSDFACRVFGPYNSTTEALCKSVLDKYN